MNKNLSQRQRFWLNLEKERKMDGFEKTQKTKIILKNGLKYLNKIPFVINHPLKEEELRNNKSEIVNNHNFSSYIKKANNNKNISPTLTKNKTAFFPKSDLIIDYYINNNLSKSNSNFFSYKDKKIFVNKNKDLGNYIQKEKEKEKMVYNNNKNYNHKIITKLRKIKREHSPKDHFIDEDLCNSNSYKNCFLRKPVVIKFEKDFNMNNTYNNTNIYNNGYPNTSKNIDSKNRNRISDVNCTEKEINTYNFNEKKPLKSELFRNYEDLEKKSFEISMRKLRKNLSCKSIDFKKDKNLREIKKSLKTIKNSHSKDKKDNTKKLKIIKFNDIKNYKKIKLLKNNNLSLNSINNIKNDNNKYNTQQQQNIYDGGIEEKSNFKKKQNKRIYFKNKLVSNKEKNNSKTINNTINSKEKKQRKNIELNDTVYKKLNTNQKEYQIVTKENHRKNKTPIIRKKFIEDYKHISINSNKLSYSHIFSSSNLSLKKNKSQKHIKVNIKNSTSLIKNKNKILPSILEEEEKIRNSNNRIIKISIINFIKILQKIIDSNNSQILRAKFELLVLYSDKIKTNRQTTKNSFSQFSDMKYVKKIIPNNIKKNKINAKCNLKKNIIQKNSFDVEKQKIFLLKRKNLKPFEKYENCKDFIENFRIQLIKTLFNERK